MSLGLETERLRLRPWRESDLPAYAEFCASDAAEFVGGRCSAEDAWRRIATFLGHWALRGFGPWIMVDKSSGRPAGYTGLWMPSGWPEGEILWSLFDGFRGRGFATEAATHVRRHAYEELGWATAASFIHPKNAASLAVAERLGCAREGAIDLRGATIEIWRHPPPSRLLN
ncbi:MAG TPA: GNAT family N-acetyltransferase [Hyphomicrobiaceae bacterium]|nr:GNAT family N-acetyltransferase [Hyphomicrobiaceae bacterium]